MNLIFSSKILLIILIVLIVLIKNRRFTTCRILMTSSSLFLLPFLLYIYPGLAVDGLSFILGTIKTKLAFETLFTFLITVSITIIIIAVLVKFNINPCFKKMVIDRERNRYITLVQGRSLLQYSIWYTLYIIIIHLPICFFTVVVSSFSPMVIMYAPYIIFSLFTMYGVATLMSINGAIRVKGKSVLKILILMFIPFINFIMMIKLNYEAKKTLKEQG